MDRTKTLLAILFVAAALGALFLSIRTASISDLGTSGLIAASAARAAPDFTLSEVGTERRVQLAAQTKSGPLVLDFWATWCGPCHQELPHLVAVSRKYQGRAAFYGVNPSDTSAGILAYQKQNAMTYPTLLDSRHTAAFAYGADAFPLVVVIDRAGKVRFAQSGYDPGEDLEAALSKVLDSLLAE